MLAGEKYQTREGQEKVKWIELGVIMEKNGKEFAIIHKHVNLAAFPSEPGKTSILCSIFDDSQQPQQGGYNNQAPQQQHQAPPPQPAPVYNQAQPQQQAQQQTAPNGSPIVMEGMDNLPF